MTTAAALSVALAAISALVALLGAAIVAARATRRVAGGRRERKTGSVRPFLLAMLAEEDQSVAQDLLARLLDLDRPTWNALEPTVGQLLGKVRGSSHDLLRTLLRLRGTVDQAERRVHRIGAVGRARAAELLGALEDPAVTAHLVRRLGDRDPEVRQVAARALGRSGDPAAAAPLLRCLAGGSVPPRVVSQALLRLGPRAEPALVRAVSESDDLIRAVAVEILGLSGAVAASGVMQSCLATDPSMEVRIRAARSLGRVGLPGALPALLDATVAHQPTALRAVAARALGDLGHPAAVARLRDLLSDPVHRVASNAARSLLQLGEEGVRALHAELAARPETDAAAHARDALARLGLQPGDSLAAAPEQTAVGV
jgi:hypothetical protein